jgi:hypothetical protein
MYLGVEEIVEVRELCPLGKLHGAFIGPET